MAWGGGGKQIKKFKGLNNTNSYLFESLLCARHFAKPFTNISIFYIHYNQMLMVNINSILLEKTETWRG